MPIHALTFWDRVQWAWTRAVSTWIAGCAVLGTVLLVLTFGPTIERTLWPVVSYAELRGVRMYGDNVTFALHIYKSRECREIGIAWYALDTFGRMYQLVSVTNDMPSPYYYPNLPTGHHGLPRRFLTLPPGSVALMAALDYDCRLPWRSQVVFPAISIDRLQHGGDIVVLR